MSIVHANKWKVQNPSFIGFTWSAIDIEYSWSSLNNRLEQFAKLSLKDYQRHNRPESYGWLPYLIFVIFFTLAKFLENKIYTEKRQIFALNL